MNFSVREFLPTSKEATQKVAETTGVLIRNKIADKITSTASKSASEITLLTQDVMPKEMYIPTKKNATNH